MKQFILFLFCIFIFSNLRAQPLTPYEQIYFSQLLNNQAKYWNLGDIDGYMSYYWGSDSLIFISKGNLTKGWQNIRDHYDKSYPDTLTMGKLEFSNLFFYKIDRKKIFATGSWKITRLSGNISGTFTLILKKIRDRWMIIMDHTE
jgi:hypothetical protein